MEATNDAFEFLIIEEMQGTRLDLVLSIVLPEASRNHLQKLIISDFLHLYGIQHRKNQRV